MTNNNWRVITRRPLTEEERKAYSEKLGYDVEYDNPFVYGNLPEHSQNVIITTKLGSVCVDRYFDYGSLSGFDNRGIDEVIAWMPLPEPYKEEVRE